METEKVQTKSNQQVKLTETPSQELQTQNQNNCPPDSEQQKEKKKKKKDKKKKNKKSHNDEQEVAHSEEKTEQLPQIKQLPQIEHQQNQLHNTQHTQKQTIGSSLRNQTPQQSQRNFKQNGNILDIVKNKQTIASDDIQQNQGNELENNQQKYSREGRHQEIDLMVKGKKCQEISSPNQSQEKDSQIIDQHVNLENKISVQLDQKQVETIAKQDHIRSRQEPNKSQQQQFQQELKGSDNLKTQHQLQTSDLFHQNNSNTQNTNQNPHNQSESNYNSSPQQLKQSPTDPNKNKTSLPVKEESIKSKKSMKQKEQLAELQLLLKEKLKEIKTLTNKNSKLEAKYIDLFKENKTLKKDSANILEAVTQVLAKLKSIPQKKPNTQINTNQKTNQLINVIKSSSPLKEQITNGLIQVLEMKILEELQKEQEHFQKMVAKIREQQQQSNRKLSFKNEHLMQETRKTQRLQIQKFETKIKSLETQIQEAKTLHQKQLQSARQSHNASIIQLKENLKQELLKSSTSHLEQLSSIHEEQLKSLYDQINKLNSKNSESQETIKEMDKKLDQKNAEVSKLMKEKLKLQHQINQLKMQSIKDELEETENFERKKQQSITERNQFLKIRQELEAMIRKRDQMKSQILALQQQVNKKQYQIEKKDAEIQELLAQLNYLQKSNTKNSQKQGTKFSSEVQNRDRSQKEGQSETPRQIEIKSAQELPSLGTPTQTILKSPKLIEDKQTSVQKQQYLRNIFVRYMKALIKGQNQSSSTLLRVLLTILNVPQKDKLEVEQLFNNKKKWWIF